VPPPRSPYALPFLTHYSYALRRPRSSAEPRARGASLAEVPLDPKEEPYAPVWIGAHDCASWRDQEGHGFAFPMGTETLPPVACLPTERAWRAQAPAWAEELWSRVVADVRAAGLVVELRDDVVLFRE
jgi:hypothetical protein